MRLSSFKSSLLACLIVIFAASLVGGAEEGITLINKDQLKEELSKPDVIVVDVRANHDWDSSEWKIKGAQRQIPAEAQEWMAKYSKDQKIVLYCA